MNEEYDHDPSFKPWGPLISPNYVNEPIRRVDIVVASIVWAATLINAGIAVYLGWWQTKGSRSPLRSVYVWMIWLELTVSLIMGLECYLHLLKFIKPSFAFYFTILFWWCIQVQLLLQIIINRIRIIVPDRKHSRMIMVGTAVFVTLINISVFNIWIPARLQISHRYHVINEYWDRVEKGLYLIVDALLNWYFLKTVKVNLINNGLTKYNKLVRFNQRMVGVSLMMDVMIIAAMSIPNSFVYIQFHPLAYLVKLNIEMTMGNLIKRIAVSASRRPGKAALADEFRSSTNQSTTAHQSGGATALKSKRRSSIHELASVVSYKADSHATNRVVSIAPIGNQIKKTHEVIVSTEPNPYYDQKRRTSEVEVTGGYAEKRENGQSVTVGDSLMVRSKSLESVMEGGESIKSAQTPLRTPADSDDETALVGEENRGWRRTKSPT